MATKVDKFIENELLTVKNTRNFELEYRLESLKELKKRILTGSYKEQLSDTLPEQRRLDDWDLF